MAVDVAVGMAVAWWMVDRRAMGTAVDMAVDVTEGRAVVKAVVKAVVGQLTWSRLSGRSGQSEGGTGEGESTG
jgi:hypothetical protein